MNAVHKELAAGRWHNMPLCEQMANIGSEVSRALSWRSKGKGAFEAKAVCRAFELLDLSLEAAETYPRLKELSRLREVLADFFYGANQRGSTELLWHKYFDRFGYMARRDR